METSRVSTARHQEPPQGKALPSVALIAGEGLRYDIYHPDLVLVGQRDLVIGLPGADDPTVYDGLVRVPLVHVVALEDIATAASSNGAA